MLEWLIEAERRFTRQDDRGARMVCGNQVCLGPTLEKSNVLALVATTPLQKNCNLFPQFLVDLPLAWKKFANFSSYKREIWNSCPVSGKSPQMTSIALDFKQSDF